jgi:hypothetical protein
LAHTHTSELLEKLVAQAPDGPVDLDWLLGHLDKRSFGLLLLLLGLLVIVPGVASIASLIVLFPSVEMMLGRSRPTFPQFLSRRPFDFKRFKRLAERVQPALRAIENLSRPRWTLPHAAAGRLVGAVVFLLALSAVWPLPLVNVIPGAIIVLIAIAYLQEDGLLLAVAAAAAFLSLAGFGWTLWTSGGAVMRWIGHPSQTANRGADAIAITVVSKGPFLNPISARRRERFSEWRASSSAVRPTVWAKWPPSY